MTCGLSVACESTCSSRCAFTTAACFPLLTMCASFIDCLGIAVRFPARDPAIPSCGPKQKPSATRPASPHASLYDRLHPGSVLRTCVRTRTDPPSREGGPPPRKFSLKLGDYFLTEPQS